MSECEIWYKFSDLPTKSQYFFIANAIGVISYSITLLLYFWGLHKAIKTKASTFVKTIIALVIFSTALFLASFVYTFHCKYSNRNQQYSSQPWDWKLVCGLATFFYLESQWLFSLQYVKTAFWLNDIYRQSKWQINDCTINFVNLVASLTFFAITALLVIDIHKDKLIAYLLFFCQVCPLVAIFYALLSISKSINQAKMQSNDNLQLKSRRMIFHSIFLFLSLINELLFMLLESDEIQQEVILITARIGYGVILLQLLYILQCLPNETDQRQGWCCVLNRYVPLIVLMQNRLAFRKFIEEQNKNLDLTLSDWSNYFCPEEVINQSQRNLQQHQFNNQEQIAQQFLYYSESCNHNESLKSEVEQAENDGFEFYESKLVISQEISRKVLLRSSDDNKVNSSQKLIEDCEDKDRSRSE